MFKLYHWLYTFANLLFFLFFPRLTHINGLFFLIYVYIRSYKQIDCPERLSACILPQRKGLHPLRPDGARSLARANSVAA